MTIHMATPSEIGGSLDESEVKVLHVTGPFQGMLVVNKLDDHTLDDAIAAGQVMVQEGAVVAFTPSGSLGANLDSPNGGAARNPPAAYPLPLRLICSPNPAITGTSLDVVIHLTSPTGVRTVHPMTLQDLGGGGSGPFAETLTDLITGPGLWTLDVRAGNTHGSLVAFTAQPILGAIAVSFWETTGIGLQNPPAAYPATIRVDCTPNPAPVVPAWTSVHGEVTLPNGGVSGGPRPVVDAGGGGNGPFQWEFTVNGPGAHEFRVDAAGGYGGVGNLIMLPVAP
jgi:hypothetical protein